ncbi:MAG: putative lipid II flippase FtsW [Candidatus Paceibacterota bacterium]|jgi:cell division protein FtsW
MRNKLNQLLITFSLLILFIGLIALISASAVIGEQRYGDVYYFVKRQLFQGVLIGLIAAWVFSRIDYHFWKKYALAILILNIALLLLCFVPALQSSGVTANRSINIGFINFQPSELLKISYILFLATLLSSFSVKKRKKLGGFPFICFLISLFVIGYIIIQQPATGSLVVLALSSLMVYLTAGLSIFQFLFFGLVGTLVLGFIIKVTPYRWQRITSFLSPQQDPLGQGYHIIQSLLGIGSGGLLGIGFGRSIQKFNYLPESHTDAIFSIIAEEFGFVGSLIIIILFLILISIGFKIAKRAPDEFGKFLAVGLICNIGFQAFINIGAMCQIFPITGIPLPFISYGSSSLIINLVSIGLLSNIAKQT